MVRIRFTDGAENIQNAICGILKKNNIEFEISEDPQYVFCSVFGREHLKYDGIKIWWTGENVRPDFNLFDYAIGFDYLSFGDRYVRAPLYLFYTKDYELAAHKHLSVTDDACGRLFCNFVYSNNKADKIRTEIFNALSAYKQVDSGGRYLNNVGGAVENKLEFQKKYKFSIAVENSGTPGYSTEKILQAFAAGTVPIYWGNERIGEEFNGGAFINAHRFSNIEELVEAVKRMDSDDEAYLKALRTPFASEKMMSENSLEKVREFLGYIFEMSYSQAKRTCECERKNILLAQQQTLEKLDKHRFLKKIVEKL